MPSDRFQTKAIVEELLQDEKPAYIRVSRSASEDIYEENTDFSGGAVEVKKGKDVLFVACDELVAPCLHAAELLAQEGISAGVVDAYRVKPLNEELIETSQTIIGTEKDRFPETWVLGDNPTVSVLLEWGQHYFDEVPAPHVNPDGTYSEGANKARTIRVYRSVNAGLTFRDLFAKLALCYKP